MMEGKVRESWSIVRNEAGEDSGYHCSLWSPCGCLRLSACQWRAWHRTFMVVSSDRFGSPTIGGKGGKDRYP